MKEHSAVRKVGEELVQTVSPRFRERARSIVETYYKDGILREKHGHAIRIINKAKEHGMEDHALSFIESVFQHHRSSLQSPGEKDVRSPEWLREEVARRVEREAPNWSVPDLIRKMADTLDAVRHPDAERALLHFMGSVARGAFSTVEKERILLSIAGNLEALLENQEVPRERKIAAVKALGAVAQMLDRLPDREQMRRALWRSVMDKEFRDVEKP
ncbi:TPA: hypothetical protein EYP13_03995, partial [Candidatus Micrarchaeota archaeon]|nr:hypothetical protein [Candidatus Micrarchaeota archaeon]